MRRGLVAAAVAAAFVLGTAPASAHSAMTSTVTSIAAATVEPAITTGAPATVEAGRLLTATGRAKPAQLGAPVQLWELRGRRWVPIAQSAQAKDGTFTLRLRAGLLGRHTYRAATSDAKGSFSVLSAAAAVTTVKPSTAGVRSTRLALTTPLGGRIGDNYGSPNYVTGTFIINGRRYPDSVRTASTQLSYELGANAATFGAAFALAPIHKRGYVQKGPRLVEIRVDNVVKVRRFLRDGQAFPVRLDVRGKRVVRIFAHNSGSGLTDMGSDLLMGTPVVTSQVINERGAMVGTALSSLRPVAVVGAVGFEHVEGYAEEELIGGTMRIQGPGNGTTTGSITYLLTKPYTRLVAVPGIWGETNPGLTGRVRVFGDDRLLADWPAPIGSYRRAAVDVVGVRRLRIDLSATYIADPHSYPWWWNVVLGDPRLS